MEQMKCPGQDTRFWKPDDIFVAKCPKCEAEIEFFKDDARRRCAWCGHMFYNPKIELGCAEWCQYAEKCVPDLVKAKKAAQNFKELLSDMVKSQLRADPSAWDRTAKGAAYAQDLLKAEGGDPKVVLATVLLHRVEPDRAREFLTELETEPEIIEAVMELLAGLGAERDLNQQLYGDVLGLLEEKGEVPRQFATRTAQQLAEAAGTKNKLWGEGG